MIHTAYIIKAVSSKKVRQKVKCECSSYNKAVVAVPNLPKRQISLELLTGYDFCGRSLKRGGCLF